MRVAIIAIVFLLAGCGGGGGSNPFINHSYQVPYYTPAKVANITPLYNSISTDVSAAVADVTTASLSGVGENVVVTGFKSQPATSANWNNFAISIFGWQNNQLVNQTNSWFTAGDNIISGTNSAKFADVDNNGKLDMVVAPYSDGALTTMRPAYVFFNNLNNTFTRSTINITINPAELARADSHNYVDAHDFDVADLNNDGKKDIIIADYGWNTVLAFNNGNRAFTTYTQQNRNMPGASSLAVADFLNNGTTTILAVDQGNATNKPGLYSWNINNLNNLNFTLLGLGPTPRFELPKWASYNFGGGQSGNRSHNIRVIAYDWDNSGIMDAIVLSRPSMTNSVWPKYSEIQFLKNDGNGNFTDMTDSVVVGYNTNTVVSYNPKFMDVNGDSLVDIVLPTAGDYSGANNSSQILLKTSDNKFVAAYQNVLTDFSAQTNAIANVSNSGNTLNIVKSPDNKLYLVTAVKLSNNQMAVYLSLIGDTMVNSSQAISTVQSRWPWMSDASANTVLSKTSKTYLNGQILDIDAALSPIGSLSIKQRAVTGYVIGLKADADQLKIFATDSIGRDFSINASATQVELSNYWSRNSLPDQITPRGQAEYLIGGSNYYHQNGMRFSGNDGNWSIGTPLIAVANDTYVSAQITALTFNPWIQFNGMWGSMNSTSLFEAVVTHKQGHWQSQFGFINAVSNITPGLITRVNPIQAVWAEHGYTDTKFGIFGGIRPYIISGGVDAELPTSVDRHGNLQYTKTQLSINNPVNFYARAVYTDKITSHILYKLSGMIVDNSQFRTQLELKYFY